MSSAENFTQNVRVKCRKVSVSSILNLVGLYFYFARDCPASILIIVYIEPLLVGQEFCHSTYDLYRTIIGRYTGIMSGR